MRFYKDSRQIEHYLEKYHVLEMFENPDMYRTCFSLVEINKRENIDYERVGEYLFFLLEGQVKVYSTLSNGKKLLLYFCRNFEIMGDLEFLQIKNHYVTVEAIQRTICLALDIHGKRQQLLSDTTFIKTLLYQVSNKLAKSSSNVAINMLWPVENRLSSYIRYMAQENSQTGRRYFKENLTETAEALGTSYRQLQRVLKFLCSKNILAKANGKYEILDDQHLNALSGDIYM